jgi:hypothetical protein
VTIPQLDGMGSEVLPVLAIPVELVVKHEDAVLVVGEYVENVFLERAAGLAEPPVIHSVNDAFVNIPLPGVLPGTVNATSSVQPSRNPCRSP